MLHRALELGVFLAYYVHDLSPFLVDFGGGWGIRYYGLSYALGFLGLYFGLWWQAKRGWSQLKGEHIADFVTWMIVGVVIGGRLFYCIFYGWETTLRNPLSIFRIWDGGMASHGGIIGAFVVIWVYGRWQKIPLYNLSDATGLCTPLALFLGRIANFINGELWGRPTEVAWGVIFPEAPRINGLMVARHPSQLYEAFLEGLALFVIMLVLRFRVRIDGVLTLTFVGGYAVMRIVAECFREPDAHIGYYESGLTQGQILSFAQLLIAMLLGWLLYRSRRSTS